MDPTVAAISTMLLGVTALIVVLIERSIGLRKQFRH